MGCPKMSPNHRAYMGGFPSLLLLPPAGPVHPASVHGEVTEPRALLPTRLPPQTLGLSSGLWGSGSGSLRP